MHEVLVDQVVEIQETATKLVIKADRRVLEMLQKFFMFRPADYFRSPKYVLYKQTDGKLGWDGFNRPLSIRPTLQGKKGYILRGRLQEILDWCEDLGYKVNSDGLLIRPFAHLRLDDIPPDIIRASYILDDGQRTCILRWLQETIGMNWMSVSSGKTATFSGAAAMIKTKYPKARFLYMTPTERLVNQVVAETRKFLPEWHITQFGGGEKDETGKDMVVATSAMLGRHYIRLLKDGYFRTFLGLLIDECHHIATAKTWQKVASSTPAFFRLGASDTTKADDETASNSLRGYVGPILHSITAEPLIDVGRIATPHIYIVDRPSWLGAQAEVPHIAEPGTNAWARLDGKWVRGVYAGPTFETDEEGELKLDKHKEPIRRAGYHTLTIGEVDYEIESEWCLLERTYDKAVIMFKERNAAVRDWAKYYSDQSFKTLVVATRTMHVLILQKLIQDAIGEDKVQILVGKDSTKRRDEIFAWIQDTPGGVLISPLVKEGVSLPALQAGVVADHVVDRELMGQIIGRFIRQKTDVPNIAHITIFKDNQHPRLRSNSRKLITDLQRIRGYKFYMPVGDPGSEKTARCYDTASTR